MYGKHNVHQTGKATNSPPLGHALRHETTSLLHFVYQSKVSCQLNRLFFALAQFTCLDTDLLLK